MKHEKSLAIAMRIAPILDGLTEQEINDVLEWIKRSIYEQQRPVKLQITTTLTTIKKAVEEHPEIYH